MHAWSTRSLCWVLSAAALALAHESAPASDKAASPPSAPPPVNEHASAATGPSTPGPPTPGKGCLAGGNGFLRARIRGAFTLDIDWKNAEIECEGGMRPDGSGLRVSFAGPLHSDGHRLRMVFGLASATEGRPGKELPTNLTVIFEGEERLFATRGADRCTTDDLNQERVGALGGPLRSYRVVARGFCISPAAALRGDEHIVITSFDFAGRATFADEAVAAPAAGAPTAGTPTLPQPGEKH